MLGAGLFFSIQEYVINIVILHVCRTHLQILLKTQFILKLLQVNAHWSYKNILCATQIRTFKQN